MKNYLCPNAVVEKQGVSQSIKCKAMKNGYCLCVRYCPTQKSIVHNDMARFCLKNPEREDGRHLGERKV